MKTQLTLIKLALAVLIAVGAACAVPSVFATARTWNGSTSTDWNTAGNWSPSATPGSGDTLTLTNGNSRYPVISSGSAVGSTVTMGASGTGAAATITVSGGSLSLGSTMALSGSSTVTNSGGTIALGGTLTVNSGASFVQTGGSNSLVSGASITGTFSRSAGVTVSAGTITINSGGVATNSGGILWMATGLSVAPSDNVTVNGTLGQSGGTNAIKDLSGSGTMTITGGLLKMYHDYKPTTPANFVATGGTVEWAGTGGAGAFGTAGTYNFYNVFVDGSVDPKFSKNADNVIAIAGSLTLNGGTAVPFPTGNGSTAGALFFGATQQAAGKWNGTGTGADYFNSTYLSGSGIVTVSAGPVNAYRITAMSGSPTAGVGDPLIIKLVDASGNTATTFNGDKTLTFSGLSTAGDGTHPTITDKTGATVPLGTSEAITFTNGVSTGASAAAVLTAYKAETATLNVTDGTLSSTSPGGAGVSLTIPNVAPVASADAVTRLVNSQIAIPVASLTNLWSDANHDLVTFSGVTSPSANGATVTMNGNYIIYPKTAANANDTISYTIGDGTTTSSGSINITISSTPITGQTSPKMTINGSTVTIQFYGVQGFNYTVQKATNPSGPWSDYQTISNCPGPFTVTDSVAGAGYYRLAWNP